MKSAVKLLVLLSCLGVSAQLCEIPPADSLLVGRVTRQLLAWMARRSPEELNPSIYVGLRLSNQPSQHQDDLYLNSLMIHYQQSFTSLALDHPPKPSMGQLALYLLAVRGGCKDIDTRKGNVLVTQLKHYLEEEKHRIDTAAMASLAFSCLQASGLNPGLASWISRASEHVRDKILGEETSEGYFGNIYSSPLALQALMEAPSPVSEVACFQAGAALLKGLQEGAFQNPILLSQLLPILHQRTYLSLMQLDCNDKRGPLEADLITQIPLTQEPRNIRVQLKVRAEPQLMFLHDGQYSVPEGATLEDVLSKAQEESWFTYETQTTLSGPFLTAVMGIRPGERQYWQLLRAPDTPLMQGIANYRPQDGETILLSLANS
ncbi:transcobalamin-2 isoform X2 [Dromiciops gliroides]|uniref:transcobalamin-2 isoform X2 n=1 Tax=Dromiciops gliroides TaxID=33562 RepID=UPI001CC52C0E|nr:transcobalamin-2 isoform X2 [Dromiciops gliroides]